jgi:hypothetical protein
MTLTAGPVTNENNDTARQGDTIGQLKARIERNRARSERNRRPNRPADGHNHNGHQADTRLVLTNNGLITECMRCGREVK